MFFSTLLPAAHTLSVSLSRGSRGSGLLSSRPAEHYVRACAGVHVRFSALAYSVGTCSVPVRLLPTPGAGPTRTVLPTVESGNAVDVTRASWCFFVRDAAAWAAVAAVALGRLGTQPLERCCRRQCRRPPAWAAARRCCCCWSVISHRKRAASGARTTARWHKACGAPWLAGGGGKELREGEGAGGTAGQRGRGQALGFWPGLSLPACLPCLPAWAREERVGRWPGLWATQLNACECGLPTVGRAAGACFLQASASVAQQADNIVSVSRQAAPLAETASLRD